MTYLFIMSFLKTKYFTSSILNSELELPSLGADKYTVTVSGFGSGSTMAQTAGVIFSENIQGLGLFSGCLYSDLHQDQD